MTYAEIRTAYKAGTLMLYQVLAKLIDIDRDDRPAPINAAIDNWLNPETKSDYIALLAFVDDYVCNNASR